MRSLTLILSLLSLLLALPSSAEVSFDWVTVGARFNACDSQVDGCFGMVNKDYRISKFEVTNAQYAEFLNAVAATDTNALYDTLMADSAIRQGGITRAGAPGSYTYATIVGRGAMPVNHVTFWDATRFANWLHNSQPTGAQDDSTTEDGAYTLEPSGIAANTINRNAGAGVFVPNEDEWYKAAYYDAGAMLYVDYPAGSNTQTMCTVPGAPPNTANCGDVVGDLTDVGSYTGAPSSNATFDQGGNVWEWTETIYLVSQRALRGASWFESDINLAAANSNKLVVPAGAGNNVGFRVASPIEITTPVPALGSLGMAILWNLLGLAGWWTLRAEPRRGA